MVQISEAIIVLFLVHILFWKNVYQDVFVLSTSELLETHFSHFDWLGHTRKFWKDDIFFYYPACMPVLSSFYPPHFIGAKLSRKLGINDKFRVMVWLILIHHLLGSILAFLMFRQWYPVMESLFGAVTLSFTSYNTKTNNPCIAYTMAWIPGMFIHGPIGILSVGMAILGGYYPILVYILPFSMIWNSQNIFGVLLGLPQIIPFLWYYPKSIRAESKVNQEFGKVSLSVLCDLIFPRTVGYKNGVLHSEYSLFFGILSPFLIFFSLSIWMVPFILSFLFMIGEFPVPFRVPARWAYVFVFSGTILATDGLFRLALLDSQLFILIVIQFLSLIRFKVIFPSFPFCQLQRPPLYHFSRYKAGQFKFPFRTGYFFNEKTKGYCGGFSLKETFVRNNMRDPNGEPIYH